MSTTDDITTALARVQRRLPMAASLRAGKDADALTLLADIEAGLDWYAEQLAQAARREQEHQNLAHALRTVAAAMQGE